MQLLSGNSDKNFRFDDLIKILLSLDFQVRINGSHHVFTRKEVVEIINLQPLGNMAKPYQVKQVRELVIKYKLLPNESGTE